MKLELGRWGAQREEGEEARRGRERRSGCWRRGRRGGNRHRVNVSNRVAVNCEVVDVGKESLVSSQFNCKNGTTCKNLSPNFKITFPLCHIW